MKEKLSKLDNTYIMQKFSVNDKLPQNHQEVLAQNGRGELFLTTYDHNTKIWDGGCCYYDINILYWATLPKLLG